MPHRRHGFPCRLLAPAVLAGMLTVASPVRGILFHATGDPAYNTTAPTGPLQDSGWQWLGTWGLFLGTPVHPKFFLTATHVGGRVGDPFFFRGQAYIARSEVRVPNSDLRIWGICGTFPDFAPLHTGTNLEGRTLVWFGRGTQRGAEVLLTNQALSELRGWRWGGDTRTTRWGENQVAEHLEINGLGRFLRATFDADGGPNECHLSKGDSGGPAFVLEGDRWELAGIHYAVDGPYSYVDAGPGFDAALFNHQGFYWQDDSTWVPTTDLQSPAPGSLYSTDVGAYADWILDFLAQPVPPDDAPFLQRAGSVHGPFADVPQATVDWENRLITTAIPAAPAFFRLRGCEVQQLQDPRIEGDQLVFGYGPVLSR